MARTSIPVDLFNPGQVFACLGLVEAAQALAGDARGAFDWENRGACRFHLSADGPANPVGIVLDFLARAEVGTVVPSGSTLSTAKWKLPTAQLPPDTPYPFPEPAAPATLPALLNASGTSLCVDHWGEASAATGRDNVKFWAGAGGQPGGSLMADAIELVRDQLPDCVEDPFSVSAPQSSSFRFDWRRDYIPIDAGFSPNGHSGLTMIGFPIVEVLAAIGLGHARPLRLKKLAYRYGVVGAADGGELLDPIFLRAALGAAELPFQKRRFTMNLGWPGQEGQARCITSVIEEP